MDLETELKRIALRNSILHGGKSVPSSIISNSMADPELKKQREMIIKLAPKISEEINSLSLEEQKGLAESLGADTEKHAKEQREGLPELPNKKPNGEFMELQGHVVTRFAPNPNSRLHLGSSRPLILNGLYAKKYNGKFILRFDDTDPELKVPNKDAYKWIEEDCEWLGFKPDLIIYASDRLEIYAEKAYEMYKNGGAYICTCSSEEWKKLIDQSKPCPCRDIHDEERWIRFRDEMKQGEAVLRIKTSLSHKNPAIRDWPAMRIKESINHPRVDKTQRLWPLYNFASAIDDHDFGITHIIRGQDHIVNTERQEYVFKFFEWDMPIAIHHGRLSIEGMLMSKSKIAEGIKSGEISGWDDPKVATLESFRKNGIDPQTIVKIMEKMGIKPNNATIDVNNLIGENKKFKK